MKYNPVEMMFVRYLFYPLVAIIMVFAYAFLKKKNALLQNKKVIVFVLTAALVLGLPGFTGLAGVHFSTGIYFLCQLLYVGLGILYVRALLRHVSVKLTRYRMLMELVVSLIVVLLGMYVFSLLFNWLNPLKSGILAATCALPVLIPLVFNWSYQAFLDIPPEIYKVWRYVIGKEELDLDGLDFNRMMVLEVEFSRKVHDEELIKVKAKAPANVTYGDWFQKFINDYNFKFQESPIAHADQFNQTYGWIFYVKPSFFSRRRYIDPDLSIVDNKILEAKTIVCKRVMNE